MSKYSFTFKKDNIFVEFMTEDKDVVEKQFQIWVADADDYARKHPKTIKADVAPKNAVPETPAQPVQPIQATPAEAVNPVEKAPSIDEAPKNDPEVLAENTEKVFDKASTLLKTINNIQNAEVEKIKPTETVNFEDVLEKTIDNPTFEPTKTRDKVFLNLVNSKNTTDKFHYLIITSYYLSEFEKKERFSLKQINAKLMQNLSEVIDHSMLQNAINQGFIELIPDLTGISEVGEYRLTRAGEEFFAKI